MKITVYTLKNCPVCQFLKGELEERNREYKEVEIGQEREIGNTLSKVYGTSTFPIFTITTQGTTKVFLRETDLDTRNNIIIFDVNEIKQILDQYEV